MNIFLFFNKIFFIFCYVKIPFYLEEYNFNNLNNNINFIEYLENKIIYINLSIGNYLKTYKIYIDLLDNFLILSNNSYQNFNNNITNEKNILFKNNVYVNAFCIKNNISIKNENNLIINFESNFLIGTKLNDNFYINNEKYKNILGLKYMNSNIELYNYNFLYNLKEKNIISKLIFYFNFTNNKKDLNQGNLIIGEDPHKINSLLKKEDLYKMNIIFKISFIECASIFHSIYVNNNLIEENKEIYFNVNFNGFKAPKKFFSFINISFFNEYYKNNNCFYINSNKSFIYCNSNINIKKFPEIKFYNKEINYTFVLTFKDLFIKINNKYYFLIVCENYNWIFGIPFIKKFNPVFDQENKFIGFYKKYLTENLIKNNNNNKNNNLLIINIILLLLILFLLVYNICNYLKKNRKLRANELEDNYNYFSDKK